jgi:hypothetical protein
MAALTPVAPAGGNRCAASPTRNTGPSAYRVAVCAAAVHRFEPLVVERRWAVDRYEKWLADSLIHQLLGG